VGVTANFLRFWTGQTLSQFGTRIGAVAMPVLAVEVLHANERQIGFLAAAETVSFLLIGLPAGAWVDRWLKRRTMIVADAVRFLTILIVPLLWASGQLRLWHLYVVVTVTGLATVFFDVAYQSYVPILVHDHDIGLANSRLETTKQLSITGGPAIGGLLMQVVSAPMVLLSNAAAYLMSLISLSLTTDNEQRNPGRNLRAEIGEGLRFVRDQPVIRRLVASMALSNLFASMVATLLPILVLRDLHLSPVILGIVMTAGSIGGAIGAAMAPALQRRFDIGKATAGGLMCAATFCTVNPIAGMVGSGHRPIAATLLVLAEFGMIAGALVFNVGQVSLRQSLCPKRLLGRMNASVRFVVWGSIPIAALLAGWLGSRIGVVPTMWLGGLGSLLTVLPVLRLGTRPGERVTNLPMSE
jgi:MFS family permease